MVFFQVRMQLVGENKGILLWFDITKNVSFCVKRLTVRKIIRAQANGKLFHSFLFLESNK